MYSLFSLAVYGGEAGIRITHLPEAAYRNELATFVAEGQAGSEMEVLFDGKPMTKAAFKGNSLEVNLALRESGFLVFQCGSSSLTFRLVQAGDNVALAEKEGYLYAGATPAILLAEHTIPPKHQRKWETVRLMKRLFGDPRPAVHSGLIAGASFLPASDLASLDKCTGVPAGFWTYAGPGRGLSEINGLIVAARGLTPAEIVLVALSATDQERGIDDVQFRIKLEWYLQALGTLPFRFIFVVPPPLDAAQAERMPDLAREISLIAAGNNAFFADVNRINARGDLTAASWLRPVVRRIQDTVKCEPRD